MNEMEEVRVWETFSRDQIEQIIQGNIRSVDEKMGQMMELFITSGYYLRRQYNEKMYREAGYDRFEDYVKERYGKSRSWATRMIQINEQYSIGGNDPRIDPKYKLYGVSQLQEMLYLTDEQREQATPDMTVKEIRALKTPAPVEEEQVPGQMSVEDYLQVMPEQAEDVIKPAENVIKPVENVIKPVENVIESVESVIKGSDEGSCADKVKKNIARCITGKSGSEYCGAATYCNEPVNCCAACDNDCNGRCGWLEETKEEPESNFRLPDKMIEVAMSQHEEGWFVSQWMERCPGLFQKIIDAIRDIKDSEKAKALQKKIAPYGYNGSRSNGFSYTFYGFSGGVNVSIDGEEMHMKYGQFVKEVEALYQEQQKKLATSQKEECCESAMEPEPLPADSIATGTIELSDEVIDAEYTEISEAITPQSLLAEAKKWLEDYIKCDAPKNLIEKQKIYVAALAGMVCDLEGTTKPDTIEQPELPVMKNNEQRKEFIDAYTTWPIWIDTKETGERYYRYEFPEQGTAIVVKVYYHRIYDWKIGASKWEDNFRDGWGNEEYYLMLPEKHFKDCSVNRSTLIDYLKEIQKR